MLWLYEAYTKILELGIITFMSEQHKIFFITLEYEVFEGKYLQYCRDFLLLSSCTIETGILII